MLMLNRFTGFGVRRRYRAPAVVFDGSNDYLTRGDDLTGNVDSGSGTFSGWINFQGGDGAFQRIFSSAPSSICFVIDRLDNNKFRIYGQSSPGNVILWLTTSTDIVASSGWVHIAASWTVGGTVQMYVNGVSDISVTTNSSGSIDYTQTGWAVGGDANGSNKLNAFVADLYLNLATAVDLSDPANFAKFSRGGKPVNLGANGELPTGSSPIVFLSGTAASFATNKGTGGGFTTNGALADAPSL